MHFAASGKVWSLWHFPYSLTLFTMTTSQPIPNALRQHRKQAGLRQIDIATKLGFTSTERISHWEKGSTFPHIANLFKLAAIYRVPPHDLYGEFFASIQNEMAQRPLNPAKRRYELPTSADLNTDGV